MLDLQNTYAIVGRGFCGVVNHATLVRTDFGARRIGNRDVVYIGIDPPWTGYYPHLMGQAPWLLTLPGFYSRPPMDSHFLPSDAFAEYVDGQWQALRNENVTVRFLNGLVESIEPDSKDGFRITVVGVGPSPLNQTIHADFVDICTGFGRPKMDLNVSLPGELRRELMVPTTQARRIYSGDEFLNVRTPVPAEKVVCIMGDGPTSALCCERAARSNNVIWVVRSDAARSFPRSDRFQDLIALFANGSHAIAEGYQADDVTLSGDRIVVTLTAAPGQQQRYLGYPAPPQKVTECQVLVVAIGHENEADGLVRNADWDLLECKRMALPLGLTAFDGSVRILGAAALTSERFKKLLDRRGDLNTLGLDAKLLPLQVQLPPKARASGKPNASIPIVARLVGEANEYFEEHSFEFGPNWNCAFLPNIEECLSNRNLSCEREFIDAWCRSRGSSSGPVTEIPDFASGCGELIYHCHARGADG